jgi:predicted PurR-regulated permease PerM
LIQTIDSLANSLQGNPTLAAIFTPILDTLETTVSDYAATAQSGVPAISLSVDDILSRSGQALGALTRFLGPTLSALASIFITLLISLQMTLTADEMRNWYADLIPPGYGPELNVLIMKIRLTWTGFLRGQMTLMLIIGVVTWLGGLILGLPQALFLGIIAGVMELIPNIGPTLAAVPAVILALLFGSTHLAVSNLVLRDCRCLFTLVKLMKPVPGAQYHGRCSNLPPGGADRHHRGAGAFGILGALLATGHRNGNLPSLCLSKDHRDQPAYHRLK